MQHVQFDIYQNKCDLRDDMVTVLLAGTGFVDVLTVTLSGQSHVCSQKAKGSRSGLQIVASVGTSGTICLQTRGFFQSAVFVGLRV